MTRALPYPVQTREIQDQRIRSTGLIDGLFSDLWYRDSWCLRARISICMDRREQKDDETRVIKENRKVFMDQVQSPRRKIMP